MSFILFQLKCKDCGKSWNAATGMIGMMPVNQHASQCPFCSGKNLEKIGDGWGIKRTEIKPGHPGQ